MLSCAMAILTPVELLERIEAHLLLTGQNASGFGRDLGDPSLVLELRRGRCPSLALAHRIIAAIDAKETPDGRPGYRPSRSAPRPA